MECSFLRIDSRVDLPEPRESKNDAFPSEFRDKEIGPGVVLVDGEEWERPEGESRFFIDLAEGSHRLEVRKEGFRTYTRSIEVRRGETVTLNVSLTTGGGSPAIESR